MLSRRKRYGTIAGSVAIALTLIGCSVGSHATTTGGGSISQAPISPSPTVSESPSASPSPTASPTPESTHKASPIPTTPPPPPPKPGQCRRQPDTVGKTQSAKTILHELTAASKIDEYEVAKPDISGEPRLHGKEPVVRVPLTVLKAMAAQESGWTSNCISSDQLGYGTMQMEAAATSQANEHFATTYDRMNPEGNILVANEWLDYLTVHFGLDYFKGDFNLLSNRTVTASTQSGTIKATLRDAVFAAYNTGLGTVDTKNGLHIGSIGLSYLTSVNGLMASSQPCQKSWGR
jgi:hypothetical protein